MTHDLFLVIGICVLVLSIPAILNAMLDGHAPRVAAITVLIGGGLIFMAVRGKPGGYAIADIPDLFVTVLGRILN
ncbi:hypothetical protein XMM379_002317 [Aliiroseovarius sp. xm-m-379]|uniref:50S ribosomal protein L35 n=1 Tax=Aliiroseovarius crassostreae TaxID=154981 RepID=A0A0N8IC48_9RHOB|nr:MULTISPECIES: hypothetical protein [Aliiroseovarius]KPN64907.1 hypothetical protein AKJ29_06700 [Aliiroseovarius crassostreae]NRP13738.1 hypothetical protein [Aliiroseovarius sp. xm-d-517]NRP25618.1 hypothetical protein [Aliiroseovarius sp. xm-m-379]NRP29611.1 hypothetical protein [Aliiroseovarius sp. xm-m-314]NRP34417.1 hypothetical protein [Aliiroseovarius sp. xm-a-104]